MKYIILILFTVTCQLTHAFDIKSSIDIHSIDLDALDVESLVKNQSIIANSPKICSAVTYVLYGSAKKNSTRKEAMLIDYSDRIISNKILDQSKKFLMETSIAHSNISTRAMASMTIAFAFPDDDEIAEWLSERYFFSSSSTIAKAGILGTIGTAGYNTPSTVVVIKDGLMGNNSTLVINAASCIKDNIQSYKTLLPDLVLSLLTLEERNQIYPNFSTNKNLSVSYLFLTKAVGECGTDAQTYLPLLEKLSARVGELHLKLLISRIKSKG